MYRDMIDPYEVSKLTQGSIFNYAYSDKYLDKEILGVIITARCDIENKKSPIYNYLPAVPYKIWVQEELFEILKRRKLKDVESNFLKKIEMLKYTRKTIDAFGLAEVIEKIRVKEIKGKDAILKAAQKLEIISSNLFSNEVVSEFEKDIENINKELVENKLSDYFFIDNVKAYGACVVNLREIHHFDNELAEIISDGFDFETANSEDVVKYRAITNIDNGIVQLHGVIRSPYIELLMQRFSELFSRIGVDNPSNKLAKELINSIRS
ncbi:hypothetical protein [Endozoicomonas acroporae]|uniref:hypothetical protein n=1 Tax=Endozoicomonas acroporae TaxID=1701104 RepID=UPI003D7B78DC